MGTLDQKSLKVGESKTVIAATNATKLYKNKSAKMDGLEKIKRNMLKIKKDGV